MLGAYHDGRTRLRYKNVHGARISLSDARGGPTEIYRDEIRLSDTGLVLHEIEFLAGDSWLIECEDMDQQWEELPGCVSQQQGQVQTTGQVGF